MANLLPPSLAGHPQFDALEALCTRLSALDVSRVLTHLVDEVEAAALPHLALQFHISGNEGWNLAQDDIARRSLIKRSIMLHRHKGTPWALKEAMTAAGFAGMDISEGLPEMRFNGAISYAGSSSYAAYGWAQFRVTADIGETMPVSAAATATLMRAIDEWKPVRSQLVDVQFRSSLMDTLDSLDDTTLSAGLFIDDSAILWRTYDGALHYNQGVLPDFSGAWGFNGAVSFAGFAAAGERYADSREQEVLDIEWAAQDSVQIALQHDGSHAYGGYFNFGATFPALLDSIMSIQLTRQLRFDGAHHYASELFDGLLAYGGAQRYQPSIRYVGDEITYLEA